MLCNANGGLASFANGSCRNGIYLRLPLWLAQFMKIHFLTHLEYFLWEWKFENKFFKQNPVKQ